MRGDGITPMSTRIYNKQVTPAQRARMERNRLEALARRATVVASRRSTYGFTPGLTRTSLAYTRSVPGSGEIKFNDSTIGQQTITTAGLNTAFTGAVNGVSMVLIPNGTTDNTRIGNKINLRHIRLRGTLQIPSNVVAGDRARLILYKDMQTNGAAAAVTDILATANVNSYINMDNTERFKIIKDKIIDLNPGNGTALAGSGSLLYLKSFKMNHKANCRIDYSSTTGAITELRTANYALLIISEVGLATIQGALRVTFIE